MTHRVVRGSLLVCGRPDGRLNALTAAENSICLSVNQASSIQSIGSTCESVTIGHNPSKLPLTARAIFLPRHRPHFLCEHLLHERDGKEKTYSSGALLGIYKSIENAGNAQHGHSITVESIISEQIVQKKFNDNLIRLFKSLDVNGNSYLCQTEFIEGMKRLQCSRNDEEMEQIFNQHSDVHGNMSFDEFHRCMTMNRFEIDAGVRPSIRDSTGLIQIKPNEEEFFGSNLIKKKSMQNKAMDFRGSVMHYGDINFEDEEESKEEVTSGAMKSQKFVQELYESRIASLQRFVSMTVMFHQMGDRVEKFFSKNTFGLLGYRKDRTHSIMRIATTASPISGAEVRDCKRAMLLSNKVHHSIDVISNAWLAHKKKKLA